MILQIFKKIKYNFKKVINMLKPFDCRLNISTRQNNSMINKYEIFYFDSYNDKIFCINLNLPISQKYYSTFINDMRLFLRDDCLKIKAKKEIIKYE